MPTVTLLRRAEEVESLDAGSATAQCGVLLHLMTEFDERPLPLLMVPSGKAIADQLEIANVTETAQTDASRVPACEMLLSDAEHPDPDTVLVAKARFGDPKAFEDLIARHTRRVRRAVVSIIGNVEEAHDAVQDTFLKAFEHIGDFQHRSKFSTWLLSIASNTALQRLRDDRRLECLDESGGETETPIRQWRAGQANPEELYLQVERCRLLEKALKRVPSKYRKVLVLRDIQQLSAEEASRALGLGIPALKARLFRARLMLREILARHFAMGVSSHCN